MPEATQVMRVDAPGRFAFAAVPRPSVAADEVAGPTAVSLVSPGTELAVAFGAVPRYPFPVELGYASVFRVEQVGSGAGDVAPGDLVLGMGPHATWQRRPREEVVRLPPGLPTEAAPFARLMNIPLVALATSRARPGHRVGVLGLGLVGQLAARVAAASGFEVLAADGSSGRRGLVPSGIPAAERLPDDGLDLVIECSGREEGAIAAARALRRGGELVLAGVPWRRRSDAPLFDLIDAVFHRHLTVRGGWEWQAPLRSGPPGSPPSITSLIRRALDWLAEGRIDVAGLATAIPPAALADGYRALRARTAPTLSYLVRYADPEEPDVR